MEALVQLIYRHGLLAMFLIIFLEYACFPVSSEIVLPFSGAVASLQQISFPLILLTSVVAGLLGTGVCYCIGRFGGNALLLRLTRRFPKTEKGIAASRQKFERFGTLAVLLGRMIPICRTYIAFIAGAAGQSPLRFFLPSAIGITLWNSLLIGLGYFFRENWTLVSAYYGRYKNLLLPLAAAMLLFFLLRRFLSSPKSSKKSEAGQ